MAGAHADVVLAPKVESARDLAALDERIEAADNLGNQSFGTFRKTGEVFIHRIATQNDSVIVDTFDDQLRCLIQSPVGQTVIASTGNQYDFSGDLLAQRRDMVFDDLCDATTAKMAMQDGDVGRDRVTSVGSANWSR